MCHFSSGEKPKPKRYSLPKVEIEKIAHAFFHRAIKLQIGCSAEPTLYKDLPALIQLAKQKKIPYVSITTNGNLFTPEIITECLHAGLDEITFSLHGVTKSVYEHFMRNANHDKFCQVLRFVSACKDKYPLKIRINYTMNEDNLEDLASFFHVFGDVAIDILQLRPVIPYLYAIYQKNSNQRIIEEYDKVITNIKSEAATRGIICIAPSKNQLERKSVNNSNAIILSPIRCKIDPSCCWRKDFNLETETFETYSKKYHWAKLFFTFAFKKNISKYGRNQVNLNYTIE
jgi:molybdenum cofactor biosynthesis enzyme MoaA